MDLFNKDQKKNAAVDASAGILQVKASTKLEIKKISNQIGKMEDTKEKLIEICRQAKQNNDPVIYNLAARALKLAVGNITRAQTFIPRAEMMLAAYEQTQDDVLSSVMDNVGKRIQKLFKEQSVFAGITNFDDVGERLEEHFGNQEAIIAGTDTAMDHFEVDPEIEALINASAGPIEESNHSESIFDEEKASDNDLSELKKITGVN